MKKTLLFASCLLAAVAFTACEDDTNDAGNDGGTTAPALTPDEAIAAFNTKYDLEATLDVDTATFCYASPDGQMFRWVMAVLTRTAILYPISSDNILYRPIMNM